MRYLRIAGLTLALASFLPVVVPAAEHASVSSVASYHDGGWYRGRDGDDGYRRDRDDRRSRRDRDRDRDRHRDRDHYRHYRHGDRDDWR